MNLTFIVGTGRCGSTLLHQILAGHSDSSFLSHFEEQHRRLAPLARYANTVYRQSHVPGMAGMAARFRPTEAYGLIDRTVSPIYSRPDRDLTGADVTPWLERRFRTFFESRYRDFGAPVLVHKYTGWSRIGFFSRIFPEARFVHVVRDGRAVANSWLQMRWWDGYRGTHQWQWGELSPERQTLWEQSGRSHAVLAALCWDTLVESYRHASAELGEGLYLEVRYEDLLENPADVLGDILEFSGLAWNADFTRRFERTEIRRSRVAAYERDLDPCQQAAVVRAVGPALSHYGYLAGSE